MGSARASSNLVGVVFALQQVKISLVLCLLSAHKNVDPRGNRTPNLRVWNPTRYHCAMESTSMAALRVSPKISPYPGLILIHKKVPTPGFEPGSCGVRKSVGSIPTDCTFGFDKVFTLIVVD